MLQINEVVGIMEILDLPDFCINIINYLDFLFLVGITKTDLLLILCANIYLAKSYAV